jgi:hypothetical protein
MGAEFNYQIIEKPNATHAELQQEWKSIVEQCVYEDGHGSYSGTLKECAGMVITGKHFSSGDEAYDWLTDNTEKWESAKMVSYDDIVKEHTSQITFRGKEISSWLRSAGLPFQAQCVSVQSKPSFGGTCSYETIYADQLTETQARLLKQSYEKFEEINETIKPVKKDFETLASCVKNLEHPFSKEEWSELKKSREKLLRLAPKLEKAKSDLLVRDTKYGEKLLKTKTVNRGKKWMVGGWCSS